MTPRNAILYGVVIVAAAAFVVAFDPAPPLPTAEAAPPASAPPATAAPVKAQTPIGETAPVATNGGPSDHTMFGGTPSRNMVNHKDKLAKFPEKGPEWD